MNTSRNEYIKSSWIETHMINKAVFYYSQNKIKILDVKVKWIYKGKLVHSHVWTKKDRHNDGVRKSK